MATIKGNLSAQEATARPKLRGLSLIPGGEQGQTAAGQPGSRFQGREARRCCRECISSSRGNLGRQETGRKMPKTEKRREEKKVGERLKLGKVEIFRSDRSSIARCPISPVS